MQSTKTRTAVLLPHTAHTGWAAVTAGGLPLGFGKVSGGTVKNRYPKGLRNLG